MNPVLETALEARQTGISVIPISPATSHATKKPAIAWKQYQTNLATETQIREWFKDGHSHGLAVIGGRVSGNLEMIEVEGRAKSAIPTLTELARNSGLGDLWTKLVHGWSEISPSGGYHFYLRSTEPVAKNTKLARRPSTQKELEANPHNRIQVLSETRGEGGYSICAPTPGSFHASGQAWKKLAGGPTTVPTFTPDQIEALHSLFQTLGQPTRKETTPPPTLYANDGDIQGTRPGDDYNQRATWDEILTPHGWKKLWTTGQTTYWRRPGKTDSGVSATTGHAQDADRLYVFSTSTEFEPDTPINKFHAYTALNCGGNYQKAVSELKKAGYGHTAAKIVFDIPERENSNITQLPTTPKTEQIETRAEGNTLAKVQPFPGNLATSLQGSEDYDALNIVERYQHEIAYCIERGKWLHWTGTVWEWQPADGGYVRELAKQYARTINPKSDKQERWKKSALAASGISNRLKMAATDRRVAHKHEEFDAYPFELNTPGGIVDLKTGKLLPSDPTKLHTKITRVTPKRMPTPMWDKFLDQTFNKDAELIAYMRDLLGYAATGVIRSHILPFFYGSGGNGKSVLTDVILSILNDYAGSAPAGFLMVKTTSQHETEIARLDGLRFVVSSEINPSDRFDEAKVKLLTGGDQLTARRMREDHYDFRPTHKLFLMGNHQPRVSAGGPSFWRRLRLIGFTNEVPKDQMIENLTDQLIEKEAPGILQWVVDGAQNMLANGLQEPRSVLAASEEYAEEEDSLARFVEENLKVGGGDYARVPQADVKRRYKTWCDEQAERPLSGHMFTRELKKRFGIERAYSNGVSFYTNADLYNQDIEFDEPTAWNELGGGL